MGTDILRMRRVETNPAVSTGVILRKGQGGLNLSFQVLLQKITEAFPFLPRRGTMPPNPS